jgi:hypothetical protein
MARPAVLPIMISPLLKWSAISPARPLQPAGVSRPAENR